MSLFKTEARKEQLERPEDRGPSGMAATAGTAGIAAAARGERPAAAPSAQARTAPSPASVVRDRDERDGEESRRPIPSSPSRPTGAEAQALAPLFNADVAHDYRARWGAAQSSFVGGTPSGRPTNWSPR